MPAVELKDVETKVKGVLAKYLGIAADTITPEQRLIEDLKVDSFASIELVFELEDQVGLEIPDKDFINLKTVGDVVTYVHSRLSNKAA